MIALNNVTTADAYTVANTREQAGTGFIHLLVTGNAIYWQFKLPNGDWHPAEEIFQPPANRGFRLDCRGFRCRSAAAGKAAQVTAALLGSWDVP